jgi:hypothetical protein
VNDVKTGRRFEIIRFISQKIPIIWSDGQVVQFNDVAIIYNENSQDVEESGFVSNYGYSSEDFFVEGFTEEVVLTRFRTPAQYGYVLSSENQTLDELVKQLDRSFIIERVKFNWADYIVAQSNIDITTEPSFIILQNNGTSSAPSYASSGSVTFRFTKASNEEWDRFRWVSDFFEDQVGRLATFVSYRTAATVGALPSFTTPQAGASTDIVGIIIASQTTDNVLEVKVDLTTDTTEASPVFFSLEVIKRGPTPIHTVSVNTAAAGIATPGLDAEGTNFLDVLIAACEPSGYEFKVFDGELMVEPSFGVDRTIDYSVVSS